MHSAPHEYLRASRDGYILMQSGGSIIGELQLTCPPIGTAEGSKCRNMAAHALRSGGQFSGMLICMQSDEVNTALGVEERALSRKGGKRDAAPATLLNQWARPFEAATIIEKLCKILFCSSATETVRSRWTRPLPHALQPAGLVGHTVQRLQSTQ